MSSPTVAFLRYDYECDLMESLTQSLTVSVTLAVTNGANVTRKWLCMRNPHPVAYATRLFWIRDITWLGLELDLWLLGSLAMLSSLVLRACYRRTGGNPSPFRRPWKRIQNVVKMLPSYRLHRDVSTVYLQSIEHP